MASADRRAELVRRGWSVVERIDRVVIPLLRTVAVPVLRISLGIVFVWFGLLKVFQVSPVSELVARTVYWVDPDIVVPALGAFEVTVGTLLLFGRALRLALFLLVAQLVGTFVTFLVLPNVTFRDGNPLLLTVEGEFVVKNLVLIAAGLVGGGAHPGVAVADPVLPQDPVEQDLDRVGSNPLVECPLSSST